MRAALSRLLRSYLPQHDAAPRATPGADGESVLPYLRVGAAAAELIGRFAEPTIRVQVHDWTVVIDVGDACRRYSAAVQAGRIAAVRCRYESGAPDHYFRSIEAQRFLPAGIALPATGQPSGSVVYRMLPDGWLLALSEDEGATAALDATLCSAPPAERRTG